MKTFIKFGIIIGIIDCLWFLGSIALITWVNPDILAYNARTLAGLLSIIVLILGIYFGLREAKSKNQNTLTFKMSLIIGIKISLVTAFLVSIFSFFYCTIINPNFAVFMVNEAEKSLMASGLPPQEMSIKLAHIKSEYSTSMQVIQALIGQTFVGTIASCIIGFFIKTKK